MEFLFENPIFLVIIIGIISSIFKRLKEGKQEQGQPKQQRPFSPSTQPINPQPVERPKMVKPSGAHKKGSQSANEILLEAKKIAEQAKREIQLDKTKSTRDVPNIRQEAIPSADDSKAYIHTLEERRLIDGLIWAEVLGPPRAKKTHTAMKQPYRGQRSN